MKITKTLLCLCLPGALYAQRHSYPNIVFILADDMGYGDVSYLNEDGKIQTPHLDSLAAQGVVFADAHANASVSTPTRYGVLTGRYSWRSTLKQGVLKPYEAPIITADRLTMPKMLKEKGYRTACIGKWHLGWNWNTTDGKSPMDRKNGSNLAFDREIKGGPCDVGFDYFFGIDAPNYPPYAYIHNRHLVRLPESYLQTDNVLDIRGGSGCKNWDLKKVLPVVEQKAVAYIDSMSQDKAPFFLYLPLTSPHTPIVPDEMHQGKSGLNDYADFVVQTDKVVGSVMAALKRNGLVENTIVVFTSDNGCSPKADFKYLNEKGHDPSYIFRGMKSDLFEGGHHVPCIVYGKEFPHQIVRETICLTDFMATFADRVGYAIQDNEAEDSYTLLPVLKSETDRTEREATVHHSIDGSFAIRKGEWKLLLSAFSGGWSEPKGASADSSDSDFQLYHLGRDQEETKNVAKDYPEVVKELKQLMTRYVLTGRSTPGTPQKNEGGRYWKQLEWMEADSGK